VGFLFWQLDSSPRWRVQQWHVYEHPGPGRFLHLHFHRYANRWLLAVLCGTDSTAGAGTQAWLLSGRGAAVNLSLPYPTAEYKVDGVHGESLNGNAAQSVA
jgi:hypothetical protein